MPDLRQVLPPDQQAREFALDAERSVLVRAPAGSGKTDLLTRRFLRLLAQVEDPSQIVAITFTRAAAAEMRHRILMELEAAAGASIETGDAFAMPALASRALARSQKLGWNLLEVPSQLRISTIDAFCRELAIQQPLLSGLGGGLELAENPTDLYRRAARLTLRRLDIATPSPRIAEVQNALEALLLWRDNSWRDVESQIVEMLARRDQWMHDFVLERDPDWDVLRRKLELPFRRAVLEAVARVEELLAPYPEAREQALELARFACEQKGLHRDLAEMAEFPCGPHETGDGLEAARRAFCCMADLLLIGGDATFRSRITATEGFPAKEKLQNSRMVAFRDRMRMVSGLDAALHAVRCAPPARYSDAEWEIVQACFTVLRHASAELRVLFAEAGRVDFIEVAQLAQRVMRAADGSPSDAAIAEADKTRHLLIDEFQDTSRRQRDLIASLIEAWPDAQDRSVFLVGDPMQSIYSFREADVELFLRVQERGLELGDGTAFPLDPVALAANFRTAPELTEPLNERLERVFAADDGSGVCFSSALAARPKAGEHRERLHLHLKFVPQLPMGGKADEESQQRRRECTEIRRSASAAQIAEVVELIQNRAAMIEPARARGEKYRIAVLGRARNALAPIAAALREAEIPFRAVDLEELGERPEVLDALAMARAFVMPEDRVAWLGVLRAPWCGLGLADLHRLISGDDVAILRRPIPELLTERFSLASESGQRALRRMIDAWKEFDGMRAALTTSPLGTLIEQAWRRLGGDACVDATGQANLQLVWACMDRLPSGATGVLNGELDAAIARLMAQPDPRAESDYGVQLMTIHKSKGLEFEVVIVPELQAKTGRTTTRMLSWMERGLAASDDDGETTEFLVAPVGPKGGERSSTKQWVDDALRRREKQEMRRILYVASTRAREELHLFARPDFKTDPQGGVTLCPPGDSLLRTAWPAVEEDVMRQFNSWATQYKDAELPALAAQAEILTMPSRGKPAILQRLPEDFEAPEMRWIQSSGNDGFSGITSSPSFRRHEGGPASRALGRAVHLLLEHAALLRATRDAEEIPEAIRDLNKRACIEARSCGLDQQDGDTLAAEAVKITLGALKDPIVQWLLAPHAGAESEASWTGVLDGAVRTVRADRVFRAGEPGSTTGDSWWVIDYKTAHPETADTAELAREMRPLFAPQLDVYARFLRMLHGKDIDVRAGLYYPRLLAFDWWKA